MNSTISANTQAILLLTAPLIVGRGSAETALLAPAEYKQLARHLRHVELEPADLLGPDAQEILEGAAHCLDGARVRALLERGFQLSQALEQWSTRAIWVLSRADAGFPRRLKSRLREDAPIVLYGCGDLDAQDGGGLAVVGSRDASAPLLQYAHDIGAHCAAAGETLISGGAKGVDQAAMRGAVEAGGRALGMLADSLARQVVNRDHRSLIMEQQLTLVSPYDPSVGFNVGHAMQRNKFIYALSDAALVVSSDVNKGGTWAGAVEQLNKRKLVPVYVRASGERSAGLDALSALGAIPWTVADTPATILSEAGNTMPGAQRDDALPLFDKGASHPALVREVPLPEAVRVSPREGGSGPISDESAAERLRAAVWDVLKGLLITPRTEAEVAADLQVSTSQAKAWLKHFVETGAIRRKTKPVSYVVQPDGLFADSITPPIGMPAAARRTRP